MLATSPEVSASARENCCQRGISVQFERIEVVAPRLDVVVAVQNLRLGLDFQAAQLLLQARHGARQLRQVEVDGIHLLIEAGAEDAHFAGIVEHRVEQVRVHARHFNAFHRGRLTPRQHRRAAQFQARNLILRGGFRETSGATARAGSGTVPAGLARPPRRPLWRRSAPQRSGGGWCRPGVLRQSANLSDEVAGGVRQLAGAHRSRMRESSSKLACMTACACSSPPTGRCRFGSQTSRKFVAQSPMAVMPAILARFQGDANRQRHGRRR